MEILKMTSSLKNKWSSRKTTSQTGNNDDDDEKKEEDDDGNDDDNDYEDGVDADGDNEAKVT